MTAAPLDIIPRPPEDALPWEKLSVALVDILGGMQQIVTLDELKRAEAALSNSYRGLSSFERLAQAAVDVLIAKGLVDAGDLRVEFFDLGESAAQALLPPSQGGTIPFQSNPKPVELTLALLVGWVAVAVGPNDEAAGCGHVKHPPGSRA